MHVLMSMCVYTANRTDCVLYVERQHIPMFVYISEMLVRCSGNVPDH